ncbi:MAG: DUF4328 domain-containing protein [Candidatus Nanopelagicales bacterium]
MGRVRGWFWFAVVAAALEIVVSIIAIQGLSTLKRLFFVAVASPTEEAIAAVDRAGASVDALTWPSVAILLLGLIAIIGWMHSGAKAVDDGDLGVLRYSTGWAIGAWFVPVLNLVRVPQIAADLYRAGRTAPRVGLVVGGWWSLWLLDGFLSRFAMAQPEPQTAEAVGSELDVLSTSYALSIASAAATITMLALITTGLGRAALRPRAPLTPAGDAFTPSLWAAPTSQPDPRFGAPGPEYGAPATSPQYGAPAPDPRFGVPAAPSAMAPPAFAPPSGPPVASAPPVIPPPPAAAPLAVPAAPVEEPSGERPAPPASSPYPTAGTIYPE